MMTEFNRYDKTKKGAVYLLVKINHFPNGLCNERARALRLRVDVSVKIGHYI